MKKRIVTLILCGILAVGMSIPAYAHGNDGGPHQEEPQSQPQQQEEPQAEEVSAYLYTKVVDTVDGEINSKGWYTIGQVSTSDATAATGDTEYTTEGDNWDAFMDEIESGDVDRYTPNENIDISKIDWEYYGLKGVSTGATDYVSSGNTWHIDGLYTNHNYISAITKQPTCEEAGEKTYICSDCGNSYSEAIPATGHDWNAGEVTTAATCTEDGVRTYTCNNDSSHTYTEVIPATGHSWETITMDPTCTDTGYTEQVCVACGEVKDVVILPALGHDWNEGTVTIEATCESDGVKTYVCNRDVSHTYSEVIPAIGHSWETTTVDPTCTSNGSITTTCSNCGKSTVEEISALGHDWDNGVITKQPTCESNGVITYTCNRDASHIKTEVIPATGHVWITESKDATCTESGYTEQVCTKCGQVKDFTAIPATGHNWDNGTITKKATATTDGVKTYVCKNDASHSYTEVIPATGEKEEEVIPTPTPVPENVIPIAIEDNTDNTVIYTAASVKKSTKSSKSGLKQIDDEEVPLANIHLADSVQTGDTASMRVLFGLIGLCIVVLLVIAYIKLK